MNGLRALRPVLTLYFREKKWLLFAGMVLAGVTVLAGILLLGLSGWFITATAIAGLSVATAVVFDVFAPAAGIRFLAILRTGSRYLERLVTHDAMLAVLASLREKLFRSWAKPQAAHDLLRRPAKLLFRLTADIDALDSLYLRVLVPAGAAIATALVCIVALGLVNLWLGLVVGSALLIIGLGLPLIIALQARKSMRKRAKATEALRARTIDMVAGQVELIMAGRMEAQAKAVQYADEHLAKADDKINRLDVMAGAGFGIASAAMLAGSLVAVSAIAQNGNISAPLAVFVLLVVLSAFEPFAALRRGAMELTRTILAAQRVNPNLVNNMPDFQKPQPPQHGQAVIFEHVCARYDGATTDALYDVNFSLARQEKVAVIGASGAGKSSLLALIAGELQPRSGQVSALPATLLTQKTELFQDSLRDNLLLANREASDETLIKALQDAGLGEVLAEMEEGLSSPLGEGGMGLSGGQQRRLALARLFLHDTPVWLLDEPREGLDEQTGQDVLQSLAAMGAARSFIIVTHVKREAMLADRLLVMKHGRIVENVTRQDQRFETLMDGLRA
ncbi:thiol reductant ABC exporter subunit CydC [Paenochrobactrum pullorum]|uniref:thiol reductant ABC exporter subunit CydC n=1 Tax=Paenochrobactrum pullorum TaxID=1324351 RepID=UPI0035BC44C9